VVEQANWRHLVDVRQIYATADGGIKNKFTVFNIGGNKYRLVTIINYKAGVVDIQVTVPATAVL